MSYIKQLEEQNEQLRQLLAATQEKYEKQPGTLLMVLHRKDGSIETRCIDEFKANASDMVVLGEYKQMKYGIA